MMMLKGISAHFVGVLYLKMMMTFASQANETPDDSSSNLRERFREKNKGLKFYKYSKVDLLPQTDENNGEKEENSWRKVDYRYQVFRDRYIDLEKCIEKGSGRIIILYIDALVFLMRMSQRESVQKLIERMQTPRDIWLRDYGLWFKEIWSTLWEYQQEDYKISNEKLGKENESGKPMDTEDTFANPETSSTQKEESQGNVRRSVNLNWPYQGAVEKINMESTDQNVMGSIDQDVMKIFYYLNTTVRFCLEDLRIPDLELIFSRFDVPFNLDLIIKLLAKLSLCSSGCIITSEKHANTNVNKRLQGAYDAKLQILFEQHMSGERLMKSKRFCDSFKCSGEGGGDTACHHLDNVDVEIIVNGSSSFIPASRICSDDLRILHTLTMDDFVCNCPKEDNICFCRYNRHYIHCECLAVVFTNLIDSLPANYISTKIRNYFECFFGDIGLSIDANDIDGKIFGGPDNLLRISTGEKVSSSSDCMAEATKVSKNKKDNPCSSSAVFSDSLKFKTGDDTMTGYIPRFRLLIEVFKTDHNSSIFVPTDINKAYYSQCFLVLLKFLRKYSCREFDIDFHLVEKNIVRRMKVRFNEKGRCNVEFVKPIGHLCWLTELEGEILSTLFQYLKVEDLTVWIGNPQYNENNKGAYYRALGKIFKSCAPESSTCKTLNLKVVYEALSPELIAAIRDHVNGFITCHYELEEGSPLLSNSIESVLSEKKRLVDRFSLLKVEGFRHPVAINIKLKIGYGALDNSKRDKCAEDLVNRKSLSDNKHWNNKYLEKLRDIRRMLESLIEKTSEIAEAVIDDNIKVNEFVLEFPFWNDILVTLIEVRQSQNTFGEYASIFSGFGLITEKFKDGVLVETTKSEDGGGVPIKTTKFENGVLVETTKFENGVPVKTTKFEDGVPVKTTKYKDGVPVGTREWCYFRIEKVVIEKENLADEKEWISIHFGATRESLKKREVQSSSKSGEDIDTMDTTSLKHIYPIVLEIKNIPVVFTRHLLALGILIVREAKLRNTYCFVDTLTSPNKNDKNVWRVEKNNAPKNNINALLSREKRLPEYLHHPGIFTPEKIKFFLENALSPVYHYDFYCLNRIVLELYSGKNIDFRSYVPREFFLSESIFSEKTKKDITENVTSLGIRDGEQFSMSHCIAKLLDHLLIFCIVNKHFSVPDLSNSISRCKGPRVVIYNGHDIGENFNVILSNLKTKSPSNISLDIDNYSTID